LQLLKHIRYLLCSAQRTTIVLYIVDRLFQKIRYVIYGTMVSCAYIRFVTKNNSNGKTTMYT
jgi:hypothetical protein